MAGSSPTSWHELTHDIERFGIDAGFVGHGRGRLPGKRSCLAKIVFGQDRLWPSSCLAQVVLSGLTVMSTPTNPRTPSNRIV
jgi:hypothetical protein